MGLNDEQRAMITAHWPKALKVAERFTRRYGHFDVDFEGAVADGLVQAALAFQVSRKVKFETYAGRRIFGACIDAMRAKRLRGYGRNVKYQGAPGIVSLSVLAAGREVHDVELVADEEPVGWEIEYEDEVRRLTKPFKGREGEVLRGMYLNADLIRMKACADAHDLSESRVSQIHSNATAQMRQSLEYASGKERVA